MKFSILCVRFSTHNTPTPRFVSGPAADSCRGGGLSPRRNRGITTLASRCRCVIGEADRMRAPLLPPRIPLMSFGNLFEAFLLARSKASRNSCLFPHAVISCSPDYFLGFESTGKTFEVLIQLGAILAIITVYFQRFWHVLVTLPSSKRSAEFRDGHPHRLPAGGGDRRPRARLHQDRAVRIAGADLRHCRFSVASYCCGSTR